LHFFTGGGLGDAFLANYRGLLSRLARGEDVRVVAGADDVCRCCPRLDGELCGWGAAAVLELDRLALAELGARATDWPELAGRVRSLTPRWWEEFCAGCSFAEFCTRPKG
jgi:hypothetical protein